MTIISHTTILAGVVTTFVHKESRKTIKLNPGERMAISMMSFGIYGRIAIAGIRMTGLHAAVA
ncbi:hypothetical protein AB9P05_00880 [Roseivirga sp. BDSF3-8]|uniref:hypothetical protein n=1 Tax=Roseivirga sp. BDSF3-8 TaxID=3241598 RepID=UPI0035323F1F